MGHPWVTRMSVVEAFLFPNLKSELLMACLWRAEIGIDCEEGGSLAKGGSWNLHMDGLGSRASYFGRACVFIFPSPVSRSALAQAH